MFRDSLSQSSAYRASVLLIAACSWLLPVGMVYALPVSHRLPVDLAVEAAMEAVKTCQKQGYDVTATVVTQEGLRQAVIRGDGASPHTIENSYNKAYTVITLGPVQKVSSTTEIAKAMSPPANPVGNWPIPPSPVTGLTFTSGGIAMKVGNELIAGLGVSGAPGGKFDEGCAQAGIRKISDRLSP
jgi:uncharacterized protein GlcG (DUF336 family)